MGRGGVSGLFCVEEHAPSTHALRSADIVWSKYEVAFRTGPPRAWEGGPGKKIYFCVKCPLFLPAGPFLGLRWNQVLRLGTFFAPGTIAHHFAKKRTRVLYLGPKFGRKKGSLNFAPEFPRRGTLEPRRMKGPQKRFVEGFRAPRDEEPFLRHFARPASEDGGRAKWC